MSRVSLRYEVPKSSSKVVSQIRKEVKGAERVLLATDLDREGEAIAWHVAEVAGIDTSLNNRIVFSEVTRDAILAAIEHPRRIDDALVDAQQARRAVDRIVGYRLSPTLWRNVASGISAGRVQSVALRLICDREDEIRRFVRQEYWTADGDFDRDGTGFQANLHTVDGRRVVTPQRAAELTEKGRGDTVLVLADEQAATTVTAPRPSASATSPSPTSRAGRCAATRRRPSRPPRCRARPTRGSASRRRRRCASRSSCTRG